MQGSWKNRECLRTKMREMEKGNLLWKMPFYNDRSPKVTAPLPKKLQARGVVSFTQLSAFNAMSVGPTDTPTIYQHPRLEFHKLPKIRQVPAPRQNNYISVQAMTGSQNGDRPRAGPPHHATTGSILPERATSVQSHSRPQLG